jgi:phosphoribosylaminoimidazolecarboxamide formyltransferase/IMP cyclohydrolase
MRVKNVRNLGEKMGRALISVYDKTGVVEFARELQNLGYEIISTGGTAKILRENGIKAIEVSEITGFPEILGGRVKTMHPKILAGILAKRDDPKHVSQIKGLEIDPIDIVAINLYPFRETLAKPGVTHEEIIENIDIGGPTMIRAASKNYQDVAVVIDPKDYISIISELKASGKISRETKLGLARKVFELTSHYDTMIANYFEKITENAAGSAIFGDTLTLTFEKAQDLRYGENPHQAGIFYKEVPTNSGGFSGSLVDVKQLHGKELSYNNINDAAGAIDLIKEFDGPTAVAVKHASPCGVGRGADIFEAYKNAYDADSMSIFGGIVALNREVDAETAAEIHKIFVEIVIAPSFSPDALEILSKKKNVRLLELPDISKKNCKSMLDMKKICGGILVQERDIELLNEDDIKCVTKKRPTDAEFETLKFAWKVVKFVKSNAIVLANSRQTVGVGGGQPNRITSLEIAIKNAGEKSRGSIIASDAYFPFPDCVEAAAKAGVTAIIQPGGSIKDELSIAACDELGISMLFTGMRHFRH